jgi:hypothetical protein
LERGIHVPLQEESALKYYVKPQEALITRASNPVIYLFYLFKTLSVAQTIGGLMNNELEGIWKEVSVA